MKTLQCLLVVVACSVSYFLGINTGVSFRLRDLSPDSSRLRDLSPDSSRLRLVDPPCTCVPCLPDLYCMKCGHRSRDCPKLASYFVKRGPAGGVISSNTVPLVVPSTNQQSRLAHE